MIACKEADSGLDRYLDGEMSQEERAGIDEHLRACPECARLLAERKRAMGLLAEWAAAEGGTPRESREPVVAGRHSAWLRPAAAAAAVVAVGALVWGLAPGRQATVAPAQAPAQVGHQLVMRSLDDGATVIPGRNGEPDELVVDAFPVKLSSMSSGVAVVSGKAGEPVELVVDPFPEEGN